MACLTLAALAGCGSGEVNGTAALQGLMGTPVVVHLRGPAERTTTTDATGHYAFSGLTDGSYLVVATASSTLEVEATASVAVRGGPATAPDLVLTPTGSVHGKVTLDGAATGNKAVVVFIGNTSSVAFTDDAGQYVLTNVPVGATRVSATKNGYATASTASFNVAYGAVTDAPDLDLTSGGLGVGDLNGIALLVGQNDLSNTQVNLVGTQTSLTTGADGVFSFAGVPTGTYSVSLQNGAYSEVIPSVLVSPGGAGLVINSVAESSYMGLPAGGLFAIGKVEIPRGRRVASGASSPVVSDDGTQIIWTAAGSAVQIGALQGGSATTLSSAVPDAFGLSPPSYQFTTDRVVVLTADHVLESVPRSGGTPTVLATAVQHFFLSPDKSQALFLTNYSNTSGQGTISTVPIAGGAPVQLATNSGWDTHDPRYPLNQIPQFSPNGTQVFYFVGGTNLQYYKPDLYVVPSSGGTAVLVKDAVEFFQILPKQGKVIYASAPTAASTACSIYTLALGASPPGTPVITNYLKHYDMTIDTQISNDESIIVYPAVGATMCPVASRCIGAGSITGSPPPVEVGDDWNLYGYSGYGGPITISPDNTKVFYMGAKNASLDLHCASISPPSATATALNTANSRVTTLHASPDGSKMVWVENDTAMRVTPMTCNAAATFKVPTPVNFSNYTNAPPLDLQYFSPDGSSVLAPINPTGFTASLVNISLSDGTATVLGDSVQFRGSRFSPDGSKVAMYSLAPGISDGQSPTLVVAAKDGSTKTTYLRYVSANDYGVDAFSWLSGNRLLVSRTGTPAPYAFQDGVYTVDVP